MRIDGTFLEYEDEHPRPVKKLQKLKLYILYENVINQLTSSARRSRKGRIFNNSQSS